MNKGLILILSAVLSTIGSYIPVLFGGSMLGGLSILGSLVGGLVGIWLGVEASRRWG